MADSRELMAEWLQAFAFRVVRCSEADTAFECARSGMVDALVVRVGSLGRLEDGVLLGAMVRATKSTSRIPVLVLTADSASDTAPAFRADYTQVMMLPARPSEIAATLLELLESRAA